MNIIYNPGLFHCHNLPCLITTVVKKNINSPSCCCTSWLDEKPALLPEVKVLRRCSNAWQTSRDLAELVGSWWWMDGYGIVKDISIGLVRISAHFRCSICYLSSMIYSRLFMDNRKTSYKCVNKNQVISEPRLTTPEGIYYSIPHDISYIDFPMVKEIPYHIPIWKTFSKSKEFPWPPHDIEPIPRHFVQFCSSLQLSHSLFVPADLAEGCNFRQARRTTSWVSWTVGRWHLGNPRSQSWELPSGYLT